MHIMYIQIMQIQECCSFVKVTIVGLIKDMPTRFSQVQFSGDLHELNTGVVYFDHRLGAAQKHF